MCATCYNRSLQEGGVQRTDNYYRDPPDEVVVERAASGHTTKARPVERRAAVAICDRRGMSAAQIAERLGVTTRTVQRARARNRQQP